MPDNTELESSEEGNKEELNIYDFIK